MTGIERATRLMKRQKTDRIGVYEHFWGDTYHDWTSRGKIPQGESFEDHFDYDTCEAWPFNLAADLDYVPVVVAEDEDTVTTKDQNHAILRRHKKHDSTPEHVGFTVDCRERWDEIVKPKLFAEARRINFEHYRAAKRHAAEKNRFFFWSGVNVFECLHPVCGHENMLMAMIEDPDWVHDMCATYADITIAMQQELFAKEGVPDGIWYYEDMGYKGAPFMSPAMYREFIFPQHKKTCDYAHSLGIPVMMHSCGFVEPLLPGMVDAASTGCRLSRSRRAWT
ncbi:MAG: uroporphyrinogen decarboxylase family protein [Eubacteriales bacterium]